MTDLLEFVSRSPAAVAIHDRDAWVGLFAPDAIVNDPVGSKPHVGTEAIGQFYDTFIAPNTIEFEVEHDIVCGSSVMRDLTIHTTMGKGPTLHVPMHLRYDVTEADGEQRIAYLGAHWELPSMIGQLLGTGISGLRTSTSLGTTLVSNLGLGGVVGFSQGFRRVGGRGRRAASTLLDAIAAGPPSLVRAAIAHGCAFEMPFGTEVSTEAFLDQAQGLTWRKLIAAGNTVTASAEIGGRPAVILMTFESGDQPSRVQVFLNQG